MMLYYGESDYWVAQHRSMTEGSAKQAYSVEDSRRGLLARGTALVMALFSSIVCRGVKKKASLDGRV